MEFKLEIVCDECNYEGEADAWDNGTEWGWTCPDCGEDHSDAIEPDDLDSWWETDEETEDYEV